MNFEEKKMYERIICRIDMMLSNAKYELVEHIPGDGLKGYDPAFILCRNMYMQLGYIRGLEELSNALKYEMEEHKLTEFGPKLKTNKKETKEE